LEKLGVSITRTSISKTGRAINKGFTALRDPSLDLIGIQKHDTVMKNDYRKHREKEESFKHMGRVKRYAKEYQVANEGKSDK
jgi:hypothetical protein